MHIILLAVCCWNPSFAYSAFELHSVCTSVSVTHAFLLLSHIFMLLAVSVCYSLRVTHRFVLHNTPFYIDTAHCLDSHVAHCTLLLICSPNGLCYAIDIW